MPRILSDSVTGRQKFVGLVLKGQAIVVPKSAGVKRRLETAFHVLGMPEVMFRDGRRSFGSTGLGCR